MADTSASISPPNSGRAVMPLSCTHCRQRKVKCNRVFPCNHCTRLRLECHFPTRKRSVRRKPRRQDELLGRLARLEEIVGKVDPASPEPQSSMTDKSASPQDGPRDGSEVSGTVRERKKQREIDPNSPPVRYLSRDFWTNLCSEVEGLRQTLEQPSDFEDDDEPEEDSTPGSNQSISQPGNSGSPVSHTLLSSVRSTAESLPHPSPEHIMYLYSVYFSNVDLVLKILHRPTIKALMESFAMSPESAAIDRATEALLFAIYFAAVTSISNEACVRNFGEERTALQTRFRLATEIALNRADYLTSSQLEPLQAFTIYIACLRVDHEGRASWALMALAVRLAQALNLHLDGDGVGLAPFEAEMRRRLWWQLITLDVRAVEDRGSEAIITSDGYNTRMLTNINDDDFGPQTTEPLVDNDGPTDVYFCLCTAKASGLFLYACDPSGRFNKTGKRSQPVPSPQDEEELIKHVQQLEAQFIEKADPAHLPSALAARTVRLIILKLWLPAQYPVMIRAAPVRTRVSHEDMLRTAVAIMELVEIAAAAPQSERYHWWTQTYVQWHPLAVALAELCMQSQGELADRAWRIIDIVFPKWSERVADTKRGNLWRPIRKLHKKAKAARLEAQMKGLGIGQGVNYRVMAPGEDGMVRSKQPWEDKSKRRSFDERSQSMDKDSPSTTERKSMSDTVDTIKNELALPGVVREAPPVPELTMPFHDSSEIFYPPDPTGYGPDAMDYSIQDWSTWNEFVMDANGVEFQMPPNTGGM